jgi:isopropylmalate/homocitrate/citramalate synthase
MEVGPRDGFQSEKQFVPTATKIKVINALSRTGLPAIQVTSFVHPKAIPQFVDAEDVVAGIDIVPGVSYRALVPNMRGLERVRRFRDRIDTINLMLSVTESHNRANGNRSIDETLGEIARMTEAAHGDGFTVSGSMICALGCPFEGQVPVETLERIADRYLELGIMAISIADTIGVANPKLVYDIVSHLVATAPMRRALPATSPPKTWSTCLMAWASRPASTSTGFSPSPGCTRSSSRTISTARCCAPAAATCCCRRPSASRRSRRSEASQAGWKFSATPLMQ